MIIHELSEKEIQMGEEAPESRWPVMLPNDVICAWPTTHDIPWQHTLTNSEALVYQPMLQADTNARPLHSIAHSFVSQSCIRKGAEAEQDFVSAALAKGWQLLQSSFSENYLQHVDFRFGLNCAQTGAQNTLTVDVKSMRHLRRGGKPQNELLFVEMHAEGWLLGGKADIIAAQFSFKPSRFVLLDRKKLIEYALKVVDCTSPLVAWPEQCFQRLFRRGTKHELISLISLQDAYEHAGCGILICN